eukprot:2943878-Amphidinium_carterae.1
MSCLLTLCKTCVLTHAMRILCTTDTRPTGGSSYACSAKSTSCSNEVTAQSDSRNRNGPT